MTNDFWEDGDIIDEPASEGKHRFGRLQMIVKNVEKVFQKGAGFTIKEIEASDFDIANGKADGNLKKFGGYKLSNNSNRKLMILVATLNDQDGNPYQMVKSYPNQVDKAADFHYWREVVFPALKEGIPKEKRANFEAAGLWAEWDELPSGQTFTNDADETNDIKYWGNIKVHGNEASLRKAEAEFFGQFGDNSSEPVPVNPQLSSAFLPEGWKTIEEVKVAVKVDWDEGKSLKEITSSFGLGKTVDGKDIDLKAFYAEMLAFDFAPDMVRMGMTKASLEE